MKRRFKFFVLLAALLLFLPALCRPGSAQDEQATVPVTDELEGFGVDDTLGGGLFDEEKFNIYGYLTELFNVTETDFGNALYLRLKGDWNPGENLAFHLEASLSNRIGNQNPFAVLESYGLSPIDQSLFPLTDFNQTMNIDHLWGMVNFPHLDLQFGKIPIAWGTGYAFNPTAKACLPAFLDTVTEETPGTIGIVPSWPLGDRFSLQGYIAFQDKSHKLTASIADGAWENLPYGIKLQTTLGSFDCSLGWIKEVMYTGVDYERKNYLAADFVGAVGDFGVYGEAALYFPESGAYPFKELIEYCLGFDYTFSGQDLNLRMEYYHQGQGESDKNNYDIMKVLSGQQMLLAEDYLFFYLDRTFSNYYSLAGGGLANLNDGSYALMAEFGYDAFDNLRLSLGAILFYGADGSEFNGEYFLGQTIDLMRPALYVKCKMSF